MGCAGRGLKSLLFLTLGSVALPFFLADSLVQAGTGKQPTIPLVGAGNDDFVPNEEWNVMASAKGDLNGDKKPDAAIVIAKINEPGPDSDDPASPRCLVIATRGADGKLHRVLADWEVIPAANSGGAGVGEAFQSLEISKGVLALNTLFGSNDRSEYDYRYVLQGSRLQTINLDYTAYVSSQAKGAEIQVDPNVGLTTCSNKIFESDSDDESPKHKAKPVIQHFYILTVEPAKALNVQSSHSISLARREDVSQGRPVWKGAADLSAKIRAVYSGKKMCLTAEVSDDVVTAGDTVRLLGAKGKVIAPVSSVRRPAEKGYVQINEYDLSSLSKEKIEPNSFVAATVEVLDFDAGAALHCALSTTRGGSRYPGDLAFCKNLEMEVLQSILESKQLF